MYGSCIYFMLKTDSYYHEISSMLLHIDISMFLIDFDVLYIAVDGLNVFKIN